MKLPPRPRLVRHSKAHYYRDYFQFYAVMCFSLVEDLTCILTLGLIEWDLRSWALFDLFEDD